MVKLFLYMVKVEKMVEVVNDLPIYESQTSFPMAIPEGNAWAVYYALCPLYKDFRLSIRRIVPEGEEIPG